MGSSTTVDFWPQIRAISSNPAPLGPHFLTASCFSSRSSCPSFWKIFSYFQRTKVFEPSDKIHYILIYMRSHMLVHLHMSFYMSFFLGGHLKKKIPWSEMLRLGKLQKGHMDWRCIFGHHPPIPPSEDPDASHGNTRRMSQKLAAKQGESGSNEVKTVLQKIQMLKDTGYLTVLNSNIYKEYLLHSVFFPIHSPFKMPICIWRTTSKPAQTFLPTTDQRKSKLFQHCGHWNVHGASHQCLSTLPAGSSILSWPHRHWKLCVSTI